ncbi:MAG: SDR family oxidoreductase [Bacteriovoracaceae bacterium]|nr:SDR family oxidoreductase [Bacteriovoracaceae bacterium]
MELGLNGKTALVFGASKGLGKAIAKTLSEEGARVAICSRNEELLEKTAEEISAGYFVTGDLKIEGDAKRVIKNVMNEFGKIDILVTNTGGPPNAIFQDTSKDQWKDGFQNLFLSTIEAVQEVLPSMKKNGWGRILFVTSVAAKEPIGVLTISNGFRAGLLGLMKTISSEVAKNGITVNALLPGYTMTERLKDLNVDEKKICAQIPAGRIGQPEEFGDMAAFLASTRASYITGQSLACDGGYLKGY